MRVEQVTRADEVLGAGIAALLPQLSPRRAPPDLAALQEIAASSGTSLLVARDGDAVLGMLTLVLR